MRLFFPKKTLHVLSGPPKTEFGTLSPPYFSSTKKLIGATSNASVPGASLSHLVNFRERVGKCRSCLGTCKKKGHSKHCKLTAVTSYSFRYNRDVSTRGEFYKRLAHGASEEEEKMIKMALTGARAI